MSSLNCRECIERFPSLSADDVSAAQAFSVREHLAACPQCQREWRAFEYTLFSLSATAQPLPTATASAAMWHGCSEHIFHKVEAQRQTPLLSQGLKSWASRQPGWSWATLGGALMILGATWFLAPHEEALTLANAALDQPSSLGTLVTFDRPSAAASGLVNHHSAMAADPFADNVGSTLVSYSATTPVSHP